MWIKICGITTLEDARAAAAAGADAIGFIFAESPRRVTPQSARKITDRLPAPIEKIGVFVNATLEVILPAVEQAGLTGVQLHGENQFGIAGLLREQGKKISHGLRIIHVLHFGGDADRFVLCLRRLTDQFPGDAILVDTGIAGRQGGTGIPFDWLAAQAAFAEASQKARIIAAGGLNSGNVELAIQTLQPWGVDVSSGVELTPGHKHPERVEAFVRAARAAVIKPGIAGVAIQK